LPCPAEIQVMWSSGLPACSLEGSRIVCSEMSRASGRPSRVTDTAKRPGLGSPWATAARGIRSAAARTDKRALSVVSPVVGHAGRHPARADRGRACPRGLPIVVGQDARLGCGAAAGQPHEARRWGLSRLGSSS
jgi:hypothetical protein